MCSARGHRKRRRGPAGRGCPRSRRGTTSTASDRQQTLEEGDVMNPSTSAGSAPALNDPAHGSDEAQLHQLGYAQEQFPHMSGFSNFAVSFTIISILSG